jgi:steroid 5-alpha reductase family enzyme
MANLPYVQLGLAWLCCAAAFAAFWWQQTRTKNANAVDIAWAAAIGLCALTFALLGSAPASTRAAIALLPGLWALRLAFHLQRRSRLAEEDSRYRYLREHWSSHTQAKFFAFYQFQALTVLLFASPFFVLANLADSWSPWQWAPALLIWLVAMLGETLADRQLSGWRSRPENRGRTCRTGLWRYSRHPNYFFEWLHW